MRTSDYPPKIGLTLVHYRENSCASCRATGRILSANNIETLLDNSGIVPGFEFRHKNVMIDVQIANYEDVSFHSLDSFRHRDQRLLTRIDCDKLG